MSKVIRTIVIAVLLTALFGAALPWLDLALYAVHLASMPAPVTLAMPVANLKRSALNDTWHAARPPRRRHEGIDIFARKGTPVVATTEGIVLRRGQNSLGG